jgi:hypothetical protein
MEDRILAESNDSFSRLVNCPQLDSAISIIPDAFQRNMTSELLNNSLARLLSKNNVIKYEDRCNIMGIYCSLLREDTENRLSIENSNIELMIKHYDQTEVKQQFELFIASFFCLMITHSKGKFIRNYINNKYIFPLLI